MEVRSKEPTINLYDYYKIRLGFKPPDDIMDLCKKTTIASCKGKLIKATIDNAVALMESMNSQDFDAPICEIVSTYMAAELAKKPKVKKK